MTPVTLDSATAAHWNSGLWELRRRCRGVNAWDRLSLRISASSFENEVLPMSTEQGLGVVVMPRTATPSAPTDGGQMGVTSP